MVVEVRQCGDWASWRHVNSTIRDGGVRAVVLKVTVRRSGMGVEGRTLWLRCGVMATEWRSALVEFGLARAVRKTVAIWLLGGFIEERS